MLLIYYTTLSHKRHMAHLNSEKQKIIKRVNRLKGQLDAFVQAIEDDKGCYESLIILASCRGAFSGLVKDLIDDHIIEHVINASSKKLASEAGKDLSKVFRTFWK